MTGQFGDPLSVIRLHEGLKLFSDFFELIIEAVNLCLVHLEIQSLVLVCLCVLHFELHESDRVLGLGLKAGRSLYVQPPVDIHQPIRLADV